MTTSTQIVIDLDVHKVIEEHREDFQESPNAILRRILLKKEVNLIPRRSADDRESAVQGAHRSWKGKGRSRDLELPHGTFLILRYNDQEFDGMIDDGRYIIAEREFDSPSAAADELCRTKDGNRTSLNGKTVTYALLPGAARMETLAEIEARSRKQQ